MEKTRDTWVEINLDSLAHNYNYYKEVTKKEVFGVVKANAYGHGDVEVARKLEAMGIQMLCVSSLDEALHLKKHGIETDILIFSYVNPVDVRLYNDPQFIFTICSMEWFSLVSDMDVRLHLEVDTGMNRMGVKDIQEAKFILSSGKEIEGLYTHFSSADSDLDETQRQFLLFKYIHSVLEYEFKWVHAGNSSGALCVDDSILNANRIGLGLYGYGDDNLKPVLSWYTRIIHVQHLYKGESVGYNRDYISDRDGYFATLPVGYADGFDVRNRGLDVYTKGAYHSILGKICMDQTMISVDEDAAVGDVVELLGLNRTGGAIAAHLNTIIYVVLTGISARVQRKTVD